MADLSLVWEIIHSFFSEDCQVQDQLSINLSCSVSLMANGEWLILNMVYPEQIKGWMSEPGPFPSLHVL